MQGGDFNLPQTLQFWQSSLYELVRMKNFNYGYITLLNFALFHIVWKKFGEWSALDQPLLGSSYMMETGCERHDATPSVNKNSGQLGFKCARISDSIRGLADASVEHPSIESDVAGCSYQVSVSQEREVGEARFSFPACETVDWCRTARRLLPIFVNGMYLFICPYKAWLSLSSGLQG